MGLWPEVYCGPLAVLRSAFNTRERVTPATTIPVNPKGTHTALKHYENMASQKGISSSHHSLITSCRNLLLHFAYHYSRASTAPAFSKCGDCPYHPYRAYVAYQQPTVQSAHHGSTRPTNLEPRQLNLPSTPASESDSPSTSS